MKKIHFTLFAAVAMLVACHGSAPKTEMAATNGDFETSQEHPDGIQRMREYNYSDSVTVEGHTYFYTIHREASDSLPTVSDDEGVRYADNLYTLSLNEGTEFTQFTFSKRNFMSYLSPEFQRNGILDGMMLDKSLPGLRFAVSVSLPQSDMFEPLLLTIDPRGGMTIARDERSDVELGGDDEGV